MKITKSEISKIVQEETSRYLFEQKIKTILLEELDPTRFPMKLSQVAANPEKAKAVAYGGQKDRNPKDDVILVQDASFAVQELKPSQSSMSLGNALDKALSMMAGGMELGGNLGAFISSDNHIMDGHHRWIATAMVDPTAKVGGYQVNAKAVDLIPILNTITVGILGIDKGNPGTGGFEQFGNRELIGSTLAEVIWEKPNKRLKPDQMFNGLAKWVGATGSQESNKLDSQKKQIIQMATDKILKNLSALKFDLPSGAPARIDMPVIDNTKVAGAEQKAKDAMVGGYVDWNQPYAQTGDQKNPVGVNENRRFKKRR